MTGSNRRPPPCKGGALPAELITPAVWSRIIGRVENESTPFLKNSFVRRKIKQNDRETGNGACFLNKNRKLAHDKGMNIEESPHSDRILPIVFSPGFADCRHLYNVRPFHENQNSLRAEPDRLSARRWCSYCSLFLAFCTPQQR